MNAHQLDVAMLSALQHVGLDVDGVLTDGGIYIGPDGAEIKRFDVKDGMGIKMLQRAGLTVSIVSSRTSPATTARGRELGIEEVVQGVDDKVTAFQAVLRRQGVPPKQSAFMGDDLADLEVLRIAGLACAPSDAVPEIRNIAAVVTSAPGGRGAVRELAELICAARACESGRAHR